MSADDSAYVPALPDLAVYPNGYVDRYHYCSCLMGPNIGRANVNGRWVQVCMSCGCVIRAKENTN